MLVADSREDRLSTTCWHCLLLNNTSQLLASVCTLMSTDYSWLPITNLLSEEHAANTNTLTRHTQLTKACPTMFCIHLVYTCRKLKLELLLCWISCVAGYFKGKTGNRSLPCKPDLKILLEYVAPHNVAPCLVHYVASLWVHYKPQQNIIIIEHVLISLQGLSLPLGTLGWSTFFISLSTSDMLTSVCCAWQISNVGVFGIQLCFSIVCCIHTLVLQVPSCKAILPP